MGDAEHVSKESPARGDVEVAMSRSADARLGKEEDGGEKEYKMKLHKRMMQERQTLLLRCQGLLLIATPVALTVVQYGARGMLQHASFDHVVKASFVSWVCFAINVSVAILGYTVCCKFSRLRDLMTAINIYACGVTAGVIFGSVSLLHSDF